jgi:hypothetical protein
MKISIYASFFIIFLFCLTNIAFAALHLDKNNLPRECATCHYKSNLRGGGGSIGCLTCHGNSQRKNTNRNMPQGSIVQNTKMHNIEAEFKKMYRHPTFDLTGRHNMYETLPEVDPKAPRHADCVDCHNPHYLTKENKFAGIMAKKVVNQFAEATNEYEICFRCHGDSANLPGSYTNKRLEFSLNNPSYHPLLGEGKNASVISLIRPYKEKKIVAEDVSTISCSDCHGNDDSNGPKGVHGSRFQFILLDNFNAGDKVYESQQAYALCYRCHNRNSILNNESFRYHSLHILGKSFQQPGTSCFTCHNPHGSNEYKYLIKFNQLVVSPNSNGMLKFVEKGSSKFSGECYLKCHGVDHNPKSY